MDESELWKSKTLGKQKGLENAFFKLSIIPSDGYENTCLVPDNKFNYKVPSTGGQRRLMGLNTGRV